MLRKPPVTVAFFIQFFSFLICFFIQSANATDTACTLVANSTLCSVWSTGKVNISTAWSIATFDTELRIWGDSPQHVADFNAIYGCTWDGTGLRYVFTYACSERLFESDRACNVDPAFQNSTWTNDVTQNATFGSRLNGISLHPVCYSACQTYANSLQAIYDNPSICPVGINPNLITARQKTLQYITNFCLTTTSNSSDCIKSIDSEATTCGKFPHYFFFYLSFLTFFY